jgi:hypothetical protein
MSKKPDISIARAVSIFEEMLAARRGFCADHVFFKMPEFWDDLCDEEGKWSIRTYRSSETDELRRRAGVSAFAGRITLTVDEKLLERANNGCKFSNYVLAHEVGHLALEHFNERTKNFALYGPNGTWNAPPNTEELEANLAAVFLQCGIALLDRRWDTIQLANRAFSDITSVRNAQRFVRLELFQSLLNRPKPKLQRVIL